MVFLREGHNSDHFVLFSSASIQQSTLDGDFNSIITMSSQISTTENIVSAPIMRACTMIRGCIKTGANNTGNISTWTLRRSETTSTAFVITVPAGFNGQTFLDQDVTLFENDVIDWLFNHVDDASGIVFRGSGALFRV